MTPRQWLAELRRIDLRELELANLGSWPGPARSLVAALLLLLVLLVGYGFYLSPHLEQLERQRQEETRLRQEFAGKARQGANLPRYQEQLAVIRNSFDLLLRQLPSDTEVPGLLEDISRVGLGSGLAFEEIRLQPEVARQFYVELPIQITVTGAYHDLASFVSGVAGLPRIVTLHDFRIQPVAVGNPALLRMSIEARTYRYDAPEPHS
ncbi:type IV pilus assembly protein PilO [Pseudomonas protegens]|jgi:type IV pilus assembly protein PilO|uniref:type 4a pilus biogenesis protein PilO n=1 Tax=Pseudomonas TaxID=286 RepID=UPI0002D78CC2|nr:MULTISPECIES: type 4a pilus biogenesis protein PilO [Pseudomonas]BCQ58816.1 type 4 fimbrial biogenesis protein PilO [Pseudomonas sp. Boi14]MCU1765054.1 type 4a pilus biogenesis protein PilO [Pseudomonas protegens]OBZ26904.1 pilus assembly protein PilP [Pseudomonas protegens]OBZ28044.1 pilus assembly protein PilP [Pseudomonas protegens]OKK41438.1 pilus assembly protein PilP [Pseudomonas protegens]